MVQMQFPFNGEVQPRETYEGTTRPRQMGLPVLRPNVHKGVHAFESYSTDSRASTTSREYIISYVQR